MSTKFSLRMLLGDKFPKQLPATLGWELEYSSKFSESDDVTLSWLNDLTAREEYGDKRPVWKHEHCGVESESPVFRSVAEIDEYCDVFFEFLKETGARSTEECGGHIHVGLQKFKTKDLSKFLIAVNLCQRFFFSLAPAYRHNNRFCSADTDANLRAYIRAVRIAAPVIIDGPRNFEQVVAAFPAAHRPISPKRLAFASNPSHPRYPFNFEPLGPENRPVCKPVAKASEPRNSMGLTVLNLVGAFPQYAKSIDNTGDYGWIRHQCGYQTLEFRLLPSTVDREEWLAYLSIIS